MSQFPARIKRIRMTRKLTQKQMAELLSITESHYQYYESGAKEPSLEKFIEIADALQVSTDYLLGRVDAPEKI